MANDENELKKLFSNISEVFDQDLFDQDKIKQEPQNITQMNHQTLNQMNQMNQQQFNRYVMPECQMQKPMQMHQQQQQRMFQQPQNEMSPAAQTLKHMAQQHQVKNSMAMSYMRPTIGQAPIVQQQSNQQRIPYQPQQQFNDYSSQFHKAQMPFTPDMIKQEIMMQPQMTPMHQMKPVMSHQMVQEDVKNVVPHYQQASYQNNQFNHQQRNTFNQNQNPSMINVAMKQTQQMQFNSSAVPGGNIHIQGGQQMSGRMGDFSMQQQQQMYFNQYNRPNHHHQAGEGKF